MANAGRALGGAATGAATGAMVGSVVPGIGTAIGAVGGGLVGGLAGLFSGDDHSDEIAQLQREAMDAIKNVDIPKLQKIQVLLQPYKEAGMLTPEMEQTIFQPDSVMSQISTDPRLKSAQFAALDKLAEQSHGGLSMQDRSALDEIMRNNAVQEHGTEQAIMQNMQERGQGGSGAELAARLSASQNATNRASSQGLQVGATATQRALEAIANQGSMATNMRNQDFGEQSDKAKAQDVINHFNAANRQSVISRNTASTNTANAANLANKQDIMNRNTDVANQQSRADAAAAQQDYQNRINKASGTAGAASNYGNFLANQDARSDQKFAGVMNGLSSAAGAFATSGALNNLAAAKGGSTAAAPATGYETANSTEMPEWMRKPKGY